MLDPKTCITSMNPIMNHIRDETRQIISETLYTHIPGSMSMISLSSTQRNIIYSFGVNTCKIPKGVSGK